MHTCHAWMRGALQGDSDPLDVVELGGKQLGAGSVHRVRALGAYAMIDEGELGEALNPLHVPGAGSSAAPVQCGLMPRALGKRIKCARLL